MSNLIAPLADLLLGARCPGCGAGAVLVCRSCGEAIRPRPAEHWPRPTPRALQWPTPVVPVAAGTHADVLRRVLVAWKEDGATRLTPLLAHHLAASLLVHERGRPVAVVPVPTSAAARRARGADLVDELARAAAAHLVRLGVDVVVARALTRGRSTVDQVGLGAAARSANLAGAFRLRTDRSLAARDVVVVDDILTTGATVVEAVRVLTGAGHRPVGVATVAATARQSETER